MLQLAHHFPPDHWFHPAMNRTRPFVLALVALLLIGSTFAQAENWPNWRGPRGDGTSTESGVPTKWNGKTGDNVAWKIELPGTGHSSPVVWEDRIFVTVCIEASFERVLVCFDRNTGKKLWQTTVLSTPLEKKHTLNSFSSSTPATDGKVVYVTFLENTSDDEKKNRGNMTVAAYSVDGQQLWSVKPGVFSSTHGFCSSPVIYQDSLIVNGDHDGESYIVALARDSGEVRWKVAREHKTRSYVTPIVRNYAGREQLILSGSKSVCGYDPKSGEMIWNIDGPTEQFVASMVDNGKLLFMTAGFPEHHILAIRPDGKGNVTDSHIVWRTKENCSYVPSPVIIGDYFLIVADNGIASCYLADTGERMWKERLKRRYSASLVAAGGLAYFISDDGECTVVKPGATFEEVALNDLGEACYSSPAISHGKIYIRGEKHLFAIGR
jgi:outer membrane protein assembly factor BamB